MIVRRVQSALVRAAFLAAFAMTCGAASANSSAVASESVRAGYAALQAGNTSAAIKSLSDAIGSGSLEPETLMNALLNRALAYQQAGDHEAALADYTAAIDMDVMSPTLRATALHNRGLSQHKLGKLQQAIEDYTASLLMNPKSPHAFFNRGNALRDNGQYLFALSDYERALRAGHPDKARVLFASATTYIQLNRPNDAKRALQAALDVNPDFGQARAQLILLGDQNAKLQSADASDPILTGSVAGLAGGTLATKPDMPKAVEPPEALQASVETAQQASRKKFLDRVPEVATVAAAKPVVEEPVEVAEVPAIPVPAKKKPMPAPVENAEVADPVTTAAVSDAEPVPASAGWTVQIASAASEDAAWSTWKKMKARYKVLGDQEAHVVRADLGSKGVFYRVRVGSFASQKDAGKSCSRLKAKGVSCFVGKAGG